jgi:tetratricopeptide (TPR) repeat protein
MDIKELKTELGNCAELHKAGNYADALAILHRCFDNLDSLEELETSADLDGIDGPLYNAMYEKALEQEPEFTPLWLVLGAITYNLDYGNMEDAMAIIQKGLDLDKKKTVDYSRLFTAWHFAMKCDDQALGIVAHVPEASKKFFEDFAEKERREKAKRENGN